MFLMDARNTITNFANVLSDRHGFSKVNPFSLNIDNYHDYRIHKWKRTIKCSIKIIRIIRINATRHQTFVECMSWAFTPRKKSFLFCVNVRGIIRQLMFLYCIYSRIPFTIRIHLRYFHTSPNKSNCANYAKYILRNTFTIFSRSYE